MHVIQSLTLTDENDLHLENIKMLDNVSTVDAINRAIAIYGQLLEKLVRDGEQLATVDRDGDVRLCRIM